MCRIILYILYNAFHIIFHVMILNVTKSVESISTNVSRLQSECQQTKGVFRQRQWVISDTLMSHDKCRGYKLKLFGLLCLFIHRSRSLCSLGSLCCYYRPWTPSLCTHLFYLSTILFTIYLFHTASPLQWKMANHCGDGCSYSSTQTELCLAAFL